MAHERILSMTEKRPASIYARNEWQLFDDHEVDLSEKFAAALAAFAHLKFPLTLSDFHSAIPQTFWDTYVHFHYRGMLAGFVPIFWDKGEWFCTLVLGSISSQYRVYLVSNFASSAAPETATTDWHPALETRISRYTLCHPLFRNEIHDSTGIYLFDHD